MVNKIRYRNSSRVEIEDDVDLLEFIEDYDPQLVLKEIDRSEIIKFLGETTGNSSLNIKDLAQSYYHGDLDLRALINEIGQHEFRKILQIN